MFGRMVLPLLGGAPAVWNAAMLFFQFALLLGYAYAHVIAPWFERWGKAWLHPLLMLSSFVVLPIAISSQSSPPQVGDPTLWQLGLMASTVGLPFFWVATNGPILQRWFSLLGTKDSSDPYFLYAASNVGSLGGLLAYPFLIEPSLRLKDQSHLWMVGYGLLILGIGACALRVPRPLSQPKTTDSSEPLPRSRVLSWIGLAFVPSSFLLGITTFISTDLAAVPLLWVVPLSLYLLSFIIVFSKRPLVPHAVVAKVFPFVLAALVGLVAAGIKKPLWPIIGIHLLVFFWVCLQAHGRLAADRPHPSKLTAFYLAIAFGGVLGGVFNSLVAPTFFPDVWEYPGIMALSAFLVATSSRERWWSPAIGLGIGALLFGAILLQKNYGLTSDAVPVRLMFLSATLAAVLCARNRWRFFAVCLSILLVGQRFIKETGYLVFRERSFFGVVKVVLTPNMMRLFHGTTLHGLQSFPLSKNPEPRSYYTKTGPIGDVFLKRGVPENAGIGVVGMGAGTLAAYLQPGQSMDFYEIDPAIVIVAHTPRFFTYVPMAQQRAKVEPILGDARLQLSRTDRSYDVLVLDAYSSDAVPVHLLTREAVELYVSRLKPGGVLAFHISNRHMNLRPVLGGIAHELGLAAIVRADDAISTATGTNASEWVVLGRRDSDLGALMGDPAWERLGPTAGFKTWTDDYSSILTVLRR